ncbi:MAG: tetratricopeptide repeat protein [Myxococcota bacterium]
MTLHLDDARWRAANTARLLDEPGAVDPAWLRDYAPHDAETAAEKALLDALARTEPAVQIDEAAAIAGALEQWDPSGLHAEIRRRRWAKRAVIVTGLLAVGVAAGLVLGVGPRGLGIKNEDDHIAQAGAVSSPSDEASAVTPEAAPAPAAPGSTPASEQPDASASSWAVHSGAVVAEADGTPTALLPRGVALVAAGELCTSSGPQTEICLQDGSRFELVDGDQLELLRGRAHVRNRGERSFSVQVDDMKVEAKGPAVYVIEREMAGWSLTVEEGAPVMHTKGSHTTVQAGQTLMDKATRGRARRSVPDPRERLAAARSRRAAGDRKGAAKLYEALIAASPRSSAARVATVSLGQLYLELGRPKKARAAFERYLARGAGTLSEDAAFGRLRALRALGASSFQAAVAKFLARYPDGAYTSRVRRWAE